MLQCTSRCVNYANAYILRPSRNNQVFVEPGHGVAVDSDTRRGLLAGGCGFEQMDVVHLFGLVCPDFPEEIVARVRTIPRDFNRLVIFARVSLNNAVVPNCERRLQRPCVACISGYQRF